MKGKKSKIQEVLQGHSLFLEPLPALLWHSGGPSEIIVCPIYILKLIKARLRVLAKALGPLLDILGPCCST